VTDLGADNIRVLPLGGLGEIGKNLTVFEYQDKILLIDCGLKFPSEDMLGVDLVLPDFSYLRDRAEDIEAVVITHGHEDHLGALPWVLKSLGDSCKPTIYGGCLPIAMARSKLDERNIQGVKLCELEPGITAQKGPFEFEFIHMTHSIPDSCAVAIKTHLGTVLFSGDYKFDQTPVDGWTADVERIAALGREGVLLLCADSTNADRAGYSQSESAVGPELYKSFSRCKGRIIVTSFASNIHRVQQVVDAAEKLDRRVCLIGRSMRRNAKIGQRLGHIKFPTGLQVQPHEIGNFPDEKLVIVSTGSQGEPLSALRRMAQHDHHHVRIHSGDTVVFSATPIPGNERAINGIINSLFRIGCDVITTQDAPIHASGHGFAEEIKLLLNLARPKYVMPMHGDFKRLKAHSQLAQATGVAEENIFVGRNGLPLQIDETGAKFAKKERSGVIFVDGSDIGDLDDVGMPDRQQLSADGVCVVVVTLSSEDGHSVAQPRLLARGIPFLDNDDPVKEDALELVESKIEEYASSGQGDLELLQTTLAEDLTHFFYESTRRHPVIIPVVVET